MRRCRRHNACTVSAISLPRSTYRQAPTVTLRTSMCDHCSMRFSDVTPTSSPAHAHYAAALQVNSFVGRESDRENLNGAAMTSCESSRPTSARTFETVDITSRDDELVNYSARFAEDAEIPHSAVQSSHNAEPETLHTLRRNDNQVRTYSTESTPRFLSKTLHH